MTLGGRDTWYQEWSAIPYFNTRSDVDKNISKYRIWKDSDAHFAFYKRHVYSTRCEWGTSRAVPFYTFRTDLVLLVMLRCEKFQDNGTLIPHFIGVIIIPKFKQLWGLYLVSDTVRPYAIFLSKMQFRWTFSSRSGPVNRAV